jgi:hypothetical protein
VVLFAALLLFSEASQGWSVAIVKSIENWSRAQAHRLEDERTWRFALSDPRFMAELQIARCRAEEKALEAGEAPPTWPFSDMPTQADNRNFMV